MKKFLYGISMFLLGGGMMYGIIYYNPITTDDVVTKVEKDVTITDNGIADSVEKVYDNVIVVSTYKDNSQYASGSGFIYKVDGDDTYIITNHHVIESGNNYKITYTDGEVVNASLIGSDEYADIAVLKVKSREGYEAVLLGESNTLKVGDTTFVVGAPLDNVYSWTVTRGIISGKERLVEIALTGNNNADYIMNVIQTDAAVNAGNSGGPLCNINGEVIGVISAKISSTGVEGMGFAIPIEIASEKAEQIINGEDSNYPYLGVSMLNVADVKSYPRYSNYLKGSNATTGVLIMDVEDGSAASKAKLQSGDIILKINDIKVDNIAYLRYELYKYKIGDAITITYLRNGIEYTTDVVLSLSNKML